MINPFRTPKFKALQSKWNIILEESGHIEIEDFTLPNPPLKDWHNLGFRNIDPEVFRAKQEFYSKARSMLHTYTFKNTTHKRIWAMYSEGMPVREIADRINRECYRKTAVHSVVRKIKKDLK